MDRFFLFIRTSWLLGTLLLAGLLIIPTHLIADQNGASNSQGKWWDVAPEEETPSSKYTSILYSQIAPKLREIEKNSKRVKVDVIGQSADGRNLFLATISKPGSSGRFGHIKSLRKMMIHDPENALKKIDQYKDFKVPVFINGSIHGNEYPGTDACIRLIETLAYENSPEVLDILDNMILLINVVQNPDGRVLGTRANSKGIDINRDFITQTQPETRATVRLITEWNPMVFLDLHDDFQPMLIEPCSPPHNPNYEYDLYINWALDQAEAMEAELVANTSETGALIPFRDWDYAKFNSEGYFWDDWPPIYTPMYAMYHGAYGHTLETPYEDESGVDADYWAVWGALKFVAENKTGMIKDQIEIFRRGFFDMPQQLISEEIMARAPEEFADFNPLTIKEFPAAYVIPVAEPFQLSSHQPARLIDFLLFNDVQVEKATAAFEMNGIAYPEGTYVVWMDQPKRSLANTILEDGMDASEIDGLVFYSAPTAWSHPLLWGVSRAIMTETLSIETDIVNKAKAPTGSVLGNNSDFFGYLPLNLQAFQATNALLRRGVNVYRADTGLGTGTFIVEAQPGLVGELANQYALALFALDSIPEGAVVLREPRIAVFADAGTAIGLDELGFDYTLVSQDDLNKENSLEGYDLFINWDLYWDAPDWMWWVSRLDDAGRNAMTAFFQAGGDYIGLLGDGAYFASDAGLINFDFSVDWDADSILRLVYTPTDGLSAGFNEQDYGYVVYGLTLFDDDLPDDVQVTATLAENDFLAAGFWPGWNESDYGGTPVVVHRDVEGQDTALIGINSTFRGHPKNTFRLLGNAIYDGIE